MNSQVEILAFCADRISGLRTALESAAVDITKGTDISVLSKITRSEFDSNACFRLLTTAGYPAGFPDILDKALHFLKNPNPHQENRQTANGIFFGQSAPDGKLAFMFPGQGSQYPYMGFGLENVSDEAKKIIKTAEQAFSCTPCLMSRIHPQAGVPAKPSNEETAALQQTDVAQPAIGALSLIMLDILKKYGISADAACGHSFGELTALCAAQRIREEEFMWLAVKRGKLMAAAGEKSGDSGGMLAIKAPAETIENMIQENRADLVLANKNSPNQGVVSGPLDEIEKMRKICRKNRIISARLPVSAAFHSRLVMDAAEPFKKAVMGIPFYPGKIPVYSNTTALPYPGDTDAARLLLGDHLVWPVNFTDEITNMYKAGVRTFIEIGPKAVLTGLVKSILSGLPHEAFSVDASGGRRPAPLDLAGAICKTAALGYKVDLKNWAGAFLPFS
ncbi:MAG: ACP S-malonyltransferase [Desulfobacteraceae bacterium]|nr:ACP S-malonyltransferase [Desulfobacteraceae bacterium]